MIEYDLVTYVNCTHSSVNFIRSLKKKPHNASSRVVVNFYYFKLIKMEASPLFYCATIADHLGLNVVLGLAAGITAKV